MTASELIEKLRKIPGDMQVRCLPLADAGRPTIEIIAVPADREFELYHYKDIAVFDDETPEEETPNVGAA